MTALAPRSAISFRIALVLVMVFLWLGRLQVFAGSVVNTEVGTGCLDLELVAGSADFFGGLVAFDISASAGNTGTFDPSGSDFILPRVIFSTDGGPDGDSFYFNVFLDSTLELGTDTVRSIRLEFNSTDPNFIQDTGGGQTVAEQLNGILSTDLASYSSTRGSFWTTELSNPNPFGSITDLSVIPESSSFPFILGLLTSTVVCRARRIR